MLLGVTDEGYTAYKPRGPLGEWRLRVAAAYTQTVMLAKGRAEGFAEEIGELGRELGLAGGVTPPREACIRKCRSLIFDF